MHDLNTSLSDSHIYATHLTGDNAGECVKGISHKAAILWHPSPESVKNFMQI